MAPVALITDFGTTDSYAGALKGSILSVNDTIPIIDITHEIPPGNIAAAAFTLSSAIDSFPEKTVFCAIVDPGVRGSRLPIAAFVNRRYIVGPDNGILSWALGKHLNGVVFRIENSELLGIVKGGNDQTLIRQDLFGIVAGFLASGGSLPSLGPTITSYQIVPFPQTHTTDSTITTSILSIDHFGNIITAAASSLIAVWKAAHIATGVHSTPAPCASSYESVGQGELLVYQGSTGYIEIAVNGGNAATRFGVSIGDAITLSMR